MMKTMTGGEAAVLSLHNLGVKTVFGLPGVQNDWLYNAFYDHREKFRIIHTRHEQGAAYMGLGHALASDSPTVFNVVPGPGLLNATAAMSTAYALNAKLMCLTGQINSHSIGKDWGELHEINDQLMILRSLTKWADRANSPSEVPALIGEAFRQMLSGRPRPVGLEIPMDVLAGKGPANPQFDVLPSYDPPLDEDAVEEAAKLLGGSASPLIFVGGAAQGASDLVRQLAEALQAPVVGYRTGMGVVDARSYLSLHQPAARELWKKADVVLAIGSNMRVPARKWLKTHKPDIIRIDVDPTSHRKFFTPKCEITARAEVALPHLLEKLERHNTVRASREAELLEVKGAWVKRSAVLEPQLSYLKIVREEIGEDGIFVDELTQVGFASRIVYPVYKPRSYISTGYQGTLGYGFPTALGVKVAKPDVPVVSVTGDGGFMFAVQELATAVQHKIPLIILLFNNNRFGNVQQMQINDYGGRVIATDLHNPDFCRMSESFGAQAIRTESPEGVRLALRRAIATTDVPTVIEVTVGDMPSVDQFR
ncbi:thiamine pyrophosphate-dependent enzyme [Brucella lupini]|uniref:Thiamine pyrophosphate enzyme, central domain protein n=5 Tax=Hyphomicrobiales TaxID=356 RepID=A0A256GD68_9HYPH|nr:thiamine pyrophosphate-dependent enzyme [Brucella lupini]OYR25072.1 thiamine pyrophosphate enzyme, central domain protein [Brucella lupini]